MDLRSICQAGFRGKYCVNDWNFVLNHVLHGSRRNPTYTAFIDLKKAFDSLDRNAMGVVLKALGLHGRLLEAIMSIYTSVKANVKVGDEFSDLFECLVGVKQGDPLSPLLFTLFIDRFHDYIKSKAPGLGVRVGALMIAVLLFADDIVLLANSSTQLQQLLGLLEEFCDTMHMQVNMSKSVGVVFSNARFDPEALVGV